MMRVALTGGIASGKTTVSDTFAALGVPIADADVLSRQAVQIDSPGLTQIAQRFGSGILQTDGSLDRAKLRRIIFEDEEARSDLEAIVQMPRLFGRGPWPPDARVRSSLSIEVTQPLW